MWVPSISYRILQLITKTNFSIVISVGRTGLVWETSNKMLLFLPQRYGVFIISRVFTLSSTRLLSSVFWGSLNWSVASNQLWISWLRVADFLLRSWQSHCKRISCSSLQWSRKSTAGPCPGPPACSPRADSLRLYNVTWRPTPVACCVTPNWSLLFIISN